MNTLLQNRFIIRQSLITFIGVCLCLYFSFHLVQGNRGVVTLAALESQIETLSQKNTKISEEKERLRQKVVMMRPGTLDGDLLEERVRAVLGYRQKDEFTILSN